MKKYHGIQILRCIAASLVVVEHASNNVIRHWTNSSVMPPYGEIGVYLFFGISGFIMFSTQASEQANFAQAVNFFIRRVLRVLPIYVLATSLQFINKFRYGPDYNFLNYLKSLLFIPYIGEGGNFRPILGQGWTLNYEMFFYLVFAMSLLFSRMRSLMLCVLVFGGLSLMQESAQSWPQVLAFYANRIMLFFICGMLVAVVLKYLASPADSASPQRKRFFALPTSLLTIACALLISAGLLATYFLPLAYVFSYYLVMVFATVLLTALIPESAPNWFSQLLIRLGDASYSTYLFHGFLLGALKFISTRISSQQPVWMVAFLLLCVVLANFIGMLAYRFVEQPLARRLKDVRWRPRGSEVK